MKHRLPHPQVQLRPAPGPSSPWLQARMRSCATPHATHRAPPPTRHCGPTAIDAAASCPFMSRAHEFSTTLLFTCSEARQVRNALYVQETKSEYSYHG